MKKCLLGKKLKIIFTKSITALQGAPFSLVIRQGDFRHKREKKNNFRSDLGKQHKNFYLSDVVKHLFSLVIDAQ